MSSHLRVQTVAVPDTQSGADQRPTATQNIRSSWLHTPVDAVPPLPVVPPSLERNPESETEHPSAHAQYSHDQKSDPSYYTTNPGAYAPSANGIKQERGVETVASQEGCQSPQSPGPIPIKSENEPRVKPRPETIHIGPDENPLSAQSPTVLKGRRHTQGYQPTTQPDPAAVHDYHQLAPLFHPIQQVNGGVWKHGLCDCGDVVVCCTGLGCPCILYGRIQYRLGQRSDRKDPTNMLGYETCNGSCVAFAILCGCNLILAAIQHRKIRKNYGIPGSVGNDCVSAFCCCCCTLSQDEKEMKYREDHVRRHVGPVTGPQYKSPTGMMYPPPPG